jgi:hypothetical protein
VPIVATEDHGRTARWLLPLCFLVALTLDVLTAARTVQGGDAGEFGVLGMTGGVAHPPGYPLYTLLARGFGHLPINPPFLRIALTSAFCGATAVAVIAAIGLRLTRNVVAAAGAALCFAVSPTFWQQSGVPEVFSLHALMTALVVLCSLRVSEATGTALTREATLLGIVCGLGSANHQTIVFCAPLVPAAFVAAARTSGWRSAARGFRWFIPALLCGLTPYLLLLPWGKLDPATHSVWGHTRSWGGLVDHFLRREYGTFSLSQRRTEGTFSLVYVRECLLALVSGWSVVFFLAGLVGILLLVQRRRAFATGLILSLVLAGIFFPSLINLPFVPVSQEIARRFFIQPTVLLAPFVAIGLDESLRYTCRTLGAFVVALVVIVSGLVRFPQADWKKDTAIQRYVVAISADLPPNAVVLGTTDALHSAMHWRAWVLGERPDVHYVEVARLRSASYRRELSRELGVTLPRDAGPHPTAELAGALAPQLPTFLIPGLAGDVAGTVAVEPWGLLLKAQPDGAKPEAPDAQKIRLEQATRLFGSPGPVKSAWSSYIAASVAAPWSALADTYAGSGQVQNAQAARAVAAIFAPPSAPGDPVE